MRIRHAPNSSYYPEKPKQFRESLGLVWHGAPKTHQGWARTQVGQGHQKRVSFDQTQTWVGNGKRVNRLSVCAGMTNAPNQMPNEGSPASTETARAKCRTKWPTNCRNKLYVRLDEIFARENELRRNFIFDRTNSCQTSL